MNNPTPDFSPITPRQLDLLEKIKADKEKLRTLPPGDPETGKWPPEFHEIQKRIDDLSVKALRSGLLRRLPGESRSSGFRLVFREITGDSPEEEKYEMRILPGAGDFHPDLPPWAVNHFIDWIQMQRLREKGRETLRKTKIVGIETGMKRPRDLRLFFRVLELRGVEEKDGPDLEDDQISDSLGEMLDKSLGLVVTEKMLKQREAEEKKKTRIRKESQPWHRVIKKLVEEGLVEKVITPSGHEKNPSVQAFKKKLKNRYPHYPWDEV